VASKLVKLSTLGLGFAGWTCILAGQAILQVCARAGSVKRMALGSCSGAAARARTPRSAAIAAANAGARPLHARPGRPTGALGAVARRLQRLLLEDLHLTSANSSDRAARASQAALAGQGVDSFKNYPVQGLGDANPAVLVRSLLLRRPRCAILVASHLFRAPCQRTR